LKEAEPGKPLPELLRQHGISSGTFHRWKSRYSGLEPSQLSRLRQLERENSELKKIVADWRLSPSSPSLDNGWW
jgi:putative transposase